MDSKQLNECIACGSQALHPVLDLGEQPLANSYKKDPLDEELTFPLAINVCEDCSHTQLSVSVDPDLLFKNYLYVSGTSKTQLEYFDWFARFTMEYNGYKGNKVLDIGCNDGSQLNAFKDIACETYGIDPAENLYELSSVRHNVKCGYLDESAKDLGKFDIITCQNAFAHNTDQFGFMNIVKDMLKPDAHLFITTSQADMILNGEFDTIYHEHLSYYTILSMRALCKRAGLNLVDVVRHPIHGTSFIFIISKDNSRPLYIQRLIDNEKLTGLHDLDTYEKQSVAAVKAAKDLKEYIRLAKQAGATVIGLGAPAKGNTLMNFMNEGPDFILDENTMKQGLYAPGVGIPIYGLEYLEKYANEPSLVFVPLAWNFTKELKEKVKKIRPNNEDKFVKYFPSLEILQEFVMETIEIKKATNGFVVVVNDEEYKEYVFVREQHLIKFLKEYFKTE